MRISSPIPGSMVVPSFEILLNPERVEKAPDWQFQLGVSLLTCTVPEGAHTRHVMHRGRGEGVDITGRKFSTFPSNLKFNLIYHIQ